MLVNGKIIKGIGGFYAVHVGQHRIYECTAKGIFRYKNQKPLVGDNVSIEILDETNMKGNIVEICERNNELIRPAVANIDQAMVVFAIKSPMPNLNLLDRFLVMMESVGVKTVICFNKIDLVSEDEIKELLSIYETTGYKVLCVSALNELGIDEVKDCLRGKTTAFAGPSGVGKSSMLNMLMPGVNQQTGSISEKIERGKHTTRHTEIFNIDEDTYIMDTPGFSSMFTCECEKEDLRFNFPEFIQYEGKCKYNGCVHIGEPDCAVKEALKDGKIADSRYENYVILYNEIKNKKKY